MRWSRSGNCGNQSRVSLSRESLPSAASMRTAPQVNCLETEATREIVSGPIGTESSIFGKSAAAMDDQLIVLQHADRHPRTTRLLGWRREIHGDLVQLLAIKIRHNGAA
jgi:hypothetical protein